MKIRKAKLTNPDVIDLHIIDADGVTYVAQNSS